MVNLASGFLYRMAITLSGFVVRSVFVHYLSTDYLGINGLYSNILSMLSLADLGFGTAMNFCLYKPLAQKDNEKLIQLLALYKRVYAIVGTVIFCIGILLVPFLDVLIKDAPDVGGLTFYYLLYLLDSCMSYWFFAYRNSLISADQKAYIVSNYQTAFTLIKSVLQIILLAVFHNFTVYLLTQIACTVAQNTALAIKAKKMYPVFGKKKAESLPENEKRAIFQNVRALSLNRIAHVALNGTDSMIISAFIGVQWVGLLSNYSIVTEAITGILTQVTGAMTSSLGNFFAKESSEDGYHMFDRVVFLNYWLYGFSFVAFTTLLNPFVTVWLGEAFVLSQAIVAAIAINFFVAGVMNTLWTFRSTLGLFSQGKYRPLIVAAINIVLSIGLSYVWGVFGVLIATSISRACVNLWYDPWMIHREGFHRSVRPFFGMYLKRIALLIVMAGLMQLISGAVFKAGVTLWNFAVMVCITAAVPNGIMLLIYHKTDEYRYFRDLLWGMLQKRRGQ